MAVQQISQVQVRSGLYQDLGQLARGEFGWALDEQRLFIGNGTVDEGAPAAGVTEIVTKQYLDNYFTGGGAGGTSPGTSVNNTAVYEFAYRFKGIQGGYEVLTGPDMANPHSRTLQKKLDDVVNVLDFGARGDGLNDDTAAIQRAIDQTYNKQSSFTDPKTRRVIDFHSGTYLLSAEIRVPPYCVLRGTGRDGVIFRQTNDLIVNTLRTADSTGSVGASIASAATPPGPVEISNIRFEGNLVTEKCLVRVDSAADVLLNRCTFYGALVRPTVLDSAAAIHITSQYRTSSKVVVQDCVFDGSAIGIRISDTIGTNNITVHNSVFQNLVQAIRATTSAASLTLNMKVTGSRFNDIQQEAIYTERCSGVISYLNTYVNVGTNYLTFSAVNNSTDLRPVIKFSGNSSYSFGDMFLRPSDNKFNITTVEHGAAGIISIDTENGIRLGSRYQTIGKSLLLNPNSTNYIVLNRRFLDGVVHYSIERNNQRRSGLLSYTVNTIDNSVCFRESYTETSGVDIKVNVMYTTQSGGTVRYPMLSVQVSGDVTQNAVLTYDVKSQSNRNELGAALLA
jgi:polygalacturonase